MKTLRSVKFNEFKESISVVRINDNLTINNILNKKKISINNFEWILITIKINFFIKC